MRFTKRSLITNIFNTSFLITSLSEKHLKYYLLIFTDVYLNQAPTVDSRT